MLDTEKKKKTVPDPRGFRSYHFIDVIVFVLAVATGHFDQANPQERLNRGPYEPFLWSQILSSLRSLMNEEEIAEIYEILQQREEQTER